ncbi:Hydantoinase B/oxoprolinase [Niveomyces insectorum RCEF 264]|uniref:Hydantoinase B/oxoprolinase n=1 Tax=Niveomyces insectorum RCEF 264 TaxID=1081102 RepID=A0A167NT11_9HYPO|nr:Hydantoinase B/oxoprolinase [Niveomyces insectorum RCEF 264]
MGSLHLDGAGSDDRLRVYIDRGGTFCDCIGVVPGKKDVVVKLLSVDPANYEDAPTEGIRRILEIVTGAVLPRNQPLDTAKIASIRMGTTVATNALLERKGAKSALLITRGFGEALKIGHQTRDKLFDLHIKKADVLYEKSVEVDERVTIHHPQAEDGHIGTTVRGLSGDIVRILEPLDEKSVETSLQELYAEGYRSIAVCLAHSYTFPDHELRINKMARAIGFQHVSLSSQLTPMVKMVPRGMSATADAYLTPVMKEYVENFRQGFSGRFSDDSNQTKCQFMQSDGGLVDFRLLSGLRSILSGPAGGLVGFAKTSYDAEDGKPVIGFDMGGTSTDVSRYAGKYDHVFETTTAGITIQSPQLDIKTVAAGGGSILFWKNGLFVVGPESAGAHPGPACYRKGGPLTVTDANLFLGRLLPEFFPKIFGPSANLPLDSEVVTDKFQALTAQINQETGNHLTPEEVAVGFLNVANEAMCRPIRSLTEGKGYDAENHRLAAFGGAGGQHASSIARILNIHEVLLHQYSSILSAYGMALADVVHECQEPSSEVVSPESMPTLRKKLQALQGEVARHLRSQGFTDRHLQFERYLNLRYKGTTTSLMIAEPADGDFAAAFCRRHVAEFSFHVPGRPILVDDVRVRGIARDPFVVEDVTIAKALSAAEQTRAQVYAAAAHTTASVYFEGLGRLPTAVYRLEDLELNNSVQGPVIILDSTQTILIAPGDRAIKLDRKIVIRVGGSKTRVVRPDIIDPVHLSIFGHRFMSIAEQMGLTLQKTAISLNIKERLDFSCAVFGPDGDLVANAPHVPVHLGSMQHAVKYQHNLHAGKLKPGDVLLTNSPTAGGTHLPDLTVVSPVFDKDGKTIIFYTAARGHHRDIGGLDGISGNPRCTYLEQEGAVIDSFKLVSQGIFDEEGVRRIFVEEPAKYPDCTGSNSIDENLSDLKAQVAANQRGVNLINELFAEYGAATVQKYMAAIQANAENAVRVHLKKIARARARAQTTGPQPQPLAAVDMLDDGTQIHLAVTIDGDTGDATFDFTGTTYQTYGNYNAPPSLTRSAILYVLRCLIDEDIPLNQGCLNPVRIVVPEGTLLSPLRGAAVFAGNSTTSSRITDVLLKAFEACAASQGTLNGIQMYGGEKPRTTADGRFGGYAFIYGETICGGSGAGPTWDGVSAIHTNMTNTRATDLEVLEKRIPVLVRKFGIRHGSGGKGLHSGGDGAVRVHEARCAMTFTLNTDRRVNRPYGMAGGEPGQAGLNLARLNHPSGQQRFVNVGAKGIVHLACGEQLHIITPGGGGWGKPEEA